MSSVITLNNVSKSYKNRTILSDVSLEFESGKSYGIKGANGTGKSVLLKLIAGFAFPDSGNIIANGMKIKEDVDFIENAGIVINAPEFIEDYTAYDNLKILADINHLIGREEIDAVLSRFNLLPDKKKKVKTYSQGMKQRLRLAQAVMENPKILILDEPMNALDKSGRDLVASILREHCEKGGMLIFTSHNQEDFDDLADVTFELDNTKVVRV